MNRKWIGIGVGLAIAGVSFGASAQNFGTDVIINKPGTASARVSITNGEGSGAFRIDDGYANIDTPDGTARLTLRSGNMGLNNTNPIQKIHLIQGSTVGCRLRLQNTEGNADFGANDGQLQFYVNDATVATFTQAGNMTVTGQASVTVLEIRGGADLSENFDVSKDIEAKPGMVVSIDPANPGKLAVSREAYDHKVAGIVSGANGVNPGMVMGQQGNDIASGATPVALTGRVYCYVDADIAPVRPGDLLTTSATPGHAMKADPAQSAGATIGKAMTALESGKGLVLVLVNLH